MPNPRVLINNLHYNLPDGKALFKGLNLTFSTKKTGLVGRNGIGKSTFIKLIHGEFRPSVGSIQIEAKLAYVPQIPLIEPATTIAGFLGFETKLRAFQRILQGSTSKEDFSILNEDWEIEKRLLEQLARFDLDKIPYFCDLAKLSGGEITRLFLTKAFSNQANFLLLDEPTNHLDYKTKKILYQAIQQWHGGLIIISHERELLNLMNEIIEFNTLGLNVYGGNYETYTEQKQIEVAASTMQFIEAKKQLQMTKSSIQSSRENHEQKRSYGRQQRKLGKIDKLTANSKKGRSERTQHKLLIKQERLLSQAETQLHDTRQKIEVIEEIRATLPATQVPQKKIIIDIDHICFSYPEQPPLIQSFSLKIQGPRRIAIVGDNGSGKTTLIKLILNQIFPQEGKIHWGTKRISYLDQNTDILSPELSVLENFKLINPQMNDEDSHCCLAQFLFKNISVNKLVKNLSGGERLRASLACIFMSKCPPQLLILDEPTNHLDLDSIKIIESALKNYQGAIIAISHDHQFLTNIGIEDTIKAPFINNLFL